MKSTSLSSSEYAAYYKPYIQAIGEVVLLEELENSLQHFLDFLNSIPVEKQEYRYAEGKWTAKEIIQHLIDAERIFTYRALRFARNDKTDLAGFEENEYANQARANERTFKELMEEFKVVRLATLYLFKSLDEEELMRTGIALDNSFTVRAIGFITIGHQKHHQRIILERYL
jgi:uncharacterized damage-inducible protein DinB